MYDIAIVGATGLVGRTFLRVLEERNIPIRNLYLYASERSAGKTLNFNGQGYTVELLHEDNVIGRHVDYALFSAGSKVAEEYAKIFTDIGAVVIDNSKAFRMREDVPLIVPEVNYTDYHPSMLIANPNCSTIQAMLPLKILDNIYTLESVRYVTLQAVSGSGIRGLKDLEDTSIGLSPTYYPHPIYNNCLPHIGEFVDKYTEEELKMIAETRKILDRPTLKVSATCFRVPIRNSHTVCIAARCKEIIDIDRYKHSLSDASGISLVDNPQANIYPIPTLASGQDNILVGRLRIDIDDPHMVHFITVADNIRKGAATNAVEILQKLIQDRAKP